MDQLAADQQEQSRKCSTERLRVKLVQAGVAEQVVSDMDRPKLLDTLAHAEDVHSRLGGDDR